ncbi:MAG: phenylalanine--tRNA ligase alpha subunit [Phycisphaerae bacterium]|nr:MAG: phenylalanine--tRNA ligase alpha subunit [Phycisphaerae bacterium]
MLAELDQLEADALERLAGANAPEALDAWKAAYLGPNGRLKAAMAGLKDVPKDQKPAVGQRLNAIKATLEAAMNARRAAMPTRAALAPVDMTEPGLIDTRAVGRTHVLSRVRDELVAVFARMGFEVAEGPELEDDDHNFVKLNIPPGHPARDPGDNFYVDDPAAVAAPRMLRSQTSTVQVRVMEEAVRRGGGQLTSPIRIISPGRVYRPDTVDATHSFMFHQIEGLAVDCGLSMADLTTTLFQFCRAYFGGDAKIRFTPTFYPFTEPSAQFEIFVSLSPGSEPRWIELGGCGMVDPNVFAACGIDPEAWTGFAFGFGVERLAMSKYKIPDIRMLYENDLRFLRQL